MSNSNCPMGDYDDSDGDDDDGALSKSVCEDE